MWKKLEASEPNSCWNKAHDNEWVFVLLGRDRSAPTVIRAWVNDRIARGLNRPDDKQIIDALAAAQAMENNW